MTDRMVDMLNQATEGGQLIRVEAADYLHGCVRVVEERGGWLRPWRFSAEQVRTMGSCQAWHPGLFRQMARTTAGITIEFDTDSTEISLEIILDSEPSGTRAVLDPIRGEENLPLDGISLDVDGRHLPCWMPEDDEEVVQLSLDNPDAAPSPELVMLPGLGESRHVRIWLPALRGCTLRHLWGNGTFFNEVNQRDQLLVIGDSVAQGFVTCDSADAWPTRLADALDYDLVNQGLGGQVFQPSSLMGIAAYVEPALVVVSLGENYRYEPCRQRTTAFDIRNHLAEVARLWPTVPTYVVTPLWHDETRSPSHRMSCWERVPSMLAANVAAHDEMTLVDGLRLVDHDDAPFADLNSHLNARGAEQMARSLELLIVNKERGEKDNPSALKERARALLSDAPRRSLPMLEMLNRGMGEVVYAREGCVLLRFNDTLMTYVTDADYAAAVLAGIPDAPLLLADGLTFANRLAPRLGYDNVRPMGVALYRRKGVPKANEDRPVVPLTLSDCENRPELARLALWATGADAQRAVQQGALLGGFDDDELVGVVSVLSDGSMTAPAVAEEHRGKGWERALVSAQIARHMGRKETPWMLVDRSDATLVKVLRSAGMSVGHAGEYCLLTKAMDASSEADGASGDNVPGEDAAQ